MIRIPITVGDVHFASMEAALDYASKILHAGEPGSEITGGDAKFAAAILAARPDKQEELHGLKVVRFTRDWSELVPNREWTMCFWAELEDGTRVDFSYYKAINMIADGEKTEA